MREEVTHRFATPLRNGFDYIVSGATARNIGPA